MKATTLKTLNAIAVSLAIITMIVWLCAVFALSAGAQETKKEKGTFLKPHQTVYTSEICKKAGHVDNKLIRLRDYIHNTKYSKEDCYLHFYEYSKDNMVNSKEKVILVQPNCGGRKFKCLICDYWVKVYDRKEILIWQSE